MKRNFLIRSLFGLMRLLFVFSILLLLFSIYFELFSNNGTIGNMEVSNHHAKGYNVPARYSITVPDSIVSYMGQNKNANAIYYKHNIYDKSYGAHLNEVKNSPDAQKSKITNTIKCYSNPELDFTVNHQTANGSITIKSPNKWFTIFQLSESYFGSLSWILIFFLLMKIFSPLRKDISFSLDIAANVRLLGFLLIFYDVIQLASSFIMSRFWGHAIIDSYKNDSSLPEAIQLRINPTLEFDFTFFIVGLGLLVLYYLLKTANTIEEEHNLTV